MARKKVLDFSYLDDHLLKFTEFGPILETQPYAMDALLLDEQLMAISHIGLPKTYNPYYGALKIEHFDPEAFPDFLQLVEYISRFDASSMLAMPGNSLSCRAVEVLGTEAQKERFFHPFLSGPVWTFFAVSEPDIGSDAQHISTALTQDDTGALILNGHKYFIGGAQKASTGLVFAKHGHHSRLVMIEPDQYSVHFHVEALHPYGLLGTELSALTFDDLPVTEAQLLGGPQNGLRHGMNTISHVFEKHRPLVAAMALGTAYGLLNALDRHGIKGLNHYWRQYHSLYTLMLRIGDDFHAGSAKVHLTSLLKVRTCRLVESVAYQLAERLPREIWLTDYRLQKRYRDAFAFEYMEGTSNIHRLNAYRSFTASQGVPL
ncbi:putative acyl-CoA dehydrogenase [Xenorhabdus vietnamensis]|uniref:Putative acyl-CoA dehydrogenase n=1 Tax=Xenorhabdus vietnamensis TaxID=351656 RepID=A0A1Y2SAJ3_9GAMM|nr:acyl-CoA dehydrogenase family protein [Xenorhabdus vietnamensis]OTA14525.1 putative acyl-CoA dehydrogenase [Xenorhabdus vietnamensis]